VLRTARLVDGDGGGDCCQSPDPPESGELHGIDVRGLEKGCKGPGAGARNAAGLLPDDDEWKSGQVWNQIRIPNLETRNKSECSKA
jgi:hypothetical protein